MSQTTEFLLNDEIVEAEAPVGELVLDYLRQDERLVGTKEGCKEGDCGACAIMVGELVDGEVEYELQTSCLVPLGEMQGKQVVSIEGMNFDDELNPVQREMVDCGGTQCGFCTPGFVVSMVWYMMCGEGEPTWEGFKRAIGGNLCRCTGYASIHRAADRLVEKFSKGGEWEDVWHADDRIQALVEADLIPAHFADAAEKLQRIDGPEPPGDEEADEADFWVAGGTDIYVQEGDDVERGRVAVLNHFPHMEGIELVDGEFRCGALTSFEDFGQHPEVRRLIPKIDDHLFLIASLHLRNRATLGGNVVNASPIGDMTALLYALGSDLVLETEDSERVVPMEEFFLGYKQLELGEDEILTEIVFPDGDSATQVNFEKVSKRKALDIASVCSGARMRLNDEGEFTEANITMGGVAPVPYLLEETREFLLGEALTPEVVEEAVEVAWDEISPIGDIRGGADYKQLLVRQLMIAHFTELYPDRVEFTALAS